MTESDDDDGPDKSQQVRLVTSPEKVELWDEFVSENPDYNSRSDLIRRAVTHEIQGRQTSTSGPQTDDTAVELAGLTDTLSDLSDRFTAVEHRLTSLENEIRTDPGLEELAGNVFGLLPTERELTGFDTRAIRDEDTEKNAEKLAGDGPLDPETDRWLAESGRLDVFARLLGEPEYRVRDAIEKLQDDTTMVRTRETDGRTVYFKET